MTVVVLSDTHREAGTGLAGAARDAVADADRVVHAGDLTTEAVLDAFRERCALFAVHGNADGPAVRERLPAARTVPVGDLTLALTHRRRGGETGLALFGRERGADLVVSGHTHRPAFVDADPPLLNPGSHADPRGGPATHAELRAADGGLEGVIRRRDGTVYRSFSV